MGNTDPVWRQALHNSEHPLYSAAWVVFSEQMTFAGADRLLGEHQAEVIPFLLAILDSPELYLETSLGSGWAPIHAVELLGHWQVLEAVPRLLHVLAEDDWMSIVHDRALAALKDMGPGVVELLLPVAEQAAGNEQRITFASILSEVGQDNAQVYEYVRTVFEQQTTESDIEYMAENLLECNLQAGVALLEARIRQRRYSSRLRRILEKRIGEARTDQSGVQVRP
jgi:hypothetical protein